MCTKSQQTLVIPHMLEHLNGHNPIEALLRVETVHIRSQNPQVSQTAPDCFRVDEGLLGSRVRHADDPAAGEPFCKV
jgi:hypothetical protein